MAIEGGDSIEARSSSRTKKTLCLSSKGRFALRLRYIRVLLLLFKKSNLKPRRMGFIVTERMSSQSLIVETSGSDTWVWGRAYEETAIFGINGAETRTAGMDIRRYLNRRIGAFIGVWHTYI